MKSPTKKRASGSVVRCAIYARVSTTDQNCEMQLKDLRSYVQARGWEIREFVDTGWSGAKSSRPELDKLMADARARRVDVIAVWKLDRWGRTLAHCLASIEELRSLGVRWISMTQGLDTDESNPMARAMLGMMSVFAEFEREMIRERTHAGQKAYRAAYTAGHVGTQRHSKSGKDLPVGRRKVMFDRKRAKSLRDKGQSFRQIARELGVSVGTIHSALK